MQIFIVDFFSQYSSSHKKFWGIHDTKLENVCHVIRFDCCKMFSDTLQIYLNDSEVKLLNTGIAWSTDRSTKYKNPPCDNCDSVAKGKKISKFARLCDVWQEAILSTDVNILCIIFKLSHLVIYLFTLYLYYYSRNVSDIFSFNVTLLDIMPHNVTNLISDD